MTFMLDGLCVGSVCLHIPVSLLSSFGHRKYICPSVRLSAYFLLLALLLESLLTVLVHAHLHALLEAAGLALVPVSLVHDASARPRLASGGTMGGKEGRRDGKIKEGGREGGRVAEEGKLS